MLSLAWLEKAGTLKDQDMMMVRRKLPVLSQFTGAGQGGALKLYP